MKISRKIQSQVEARIRHAMATGPLPFADKSSATGTQQGQEMKKDEASQSGHAK